MQPKPFSIRSLEDQGLQEMLADQIEQTGRHHIRTCRGLPDLTFISACIKRVIQQNQSGRDFLQSLQDLEELEVSRSTFFEALQSQRRLHTVSQMSQAHNELLSDRLSSAGVDHLAAFPEIAGYEVFSADGHFIEHPSHVKQDPKGRVFAAGNIYAQNIRNGLLRHLATVTDGSAKGHEMPHFRKAVECADSSQKTIWVLDRAYMDNRWWEQKKSKGQYIVSRAKSNRSITYCGILPFDAGDIVNEGVVSDRLGGFTNTKSTMRIIDYVDPETGEELTFYTTLEPRIRPGLICWLYFLRWKIEKSFDCFKNELGERKAWACGNNALQIQGHCICSIYNFIVFLSEVIKKEHDCRDTKAEKKYADNLNKRAKLAREKNRNVHPLLVYCRHISRISSQIIRLVRNHFSTQTPLRDIVPLFIRRLERYL